MNFSSADEACPRLTALNRSRDKERAVDGLRSLDRAVCRMACMRETPLPSSAKSRTFELETKSPTLSSSECTGSLSAFAAVLSEGSCLTHVGGFLRTASNSSFSLVNTARVFATKQKLNRCLFENAACFTNKDGLLAEAAEGMITALYCAASGCEKDEDANQDFKPRAETAGAHCTTDTKI